MVFEVVSHDGFGVFLCLGSEVLVQNIEREFSGVDADPAESVEDAGTAAVLRVSDGFKVLPPVVGCDTVLMVNTRLIEWPHPREIDGMGDEDALVVIPWMPKYKIPLFALGIRFVFAILTGSGDSLL